MSNAEGRVERDANALIPAWTDVGAAVRRLARHLGIGPAGGDDALALDDALWNGLLETLLTLVDAGVMEMRGTAETAYEFRSAAGASIPVTRDDPARPDQAPSPSPSEELWRVRTERDDAIRLQSEAIRRAAIAEAASEFQEGQRNAALRRAEAAEAAAKEHLAQRDAALEREAEVLRRTEAAIALTNKQRAEHEELLRRVETTDTCGQQHRAEIDAAARRASEAQERAEAAEAEADRLLAERDDAMRRARHAETRVRELEGSGGADLPRGRPAGDSRAEAPHIDLVEAERNADETPAESPGEIDVRQLWLDRSRRRSGPAPGPPAR